MKWVTILLVVLFAAPAAAWETRVENGLCVLSHVAEMHAVEVTYDPAGPLYTIALTQDAPWADAPVFAIRFEGGRPLTISTDRHMLDLESRRLSVSDSGFGNVLDGLERNAQAIALTGESQITVDLEGAAPAVRDFRSCTASPIA